jgi:transcriptional regulator with XRE-family HTH domain
MAKRSPAKQKSAPPRFTDEHVVFVRNFKAARKAKQLRQWQIKSPTGFYAQSFISALERGSSAITIDTAAHLAHAVGYSLVRLLSPRPVVLSPAPHLPQRPASRPR